MKRKSALRKKLTKKMTLDQLAEMTQSGFLDLEGRLEKRIDNVEEHLTALISGVEQKVDALRGEVMSMHYDYKKVKARIESIEIKVFGSIQDA